MNQVSKPTTPQPEITAAGLPESKLKLLKPHELIRRTLDIKVAKDRWGYTQHPSWTGVDVRVSKAAKRNALIVLDRLFKALETREIKASVNTGGYGESGTFAVRGSDKVQVYVTEEHRKVPHIPTAKELKDAAEPFGRRVPKTDSVPTGNLTLVPGGIVDLSSEDHLARLIEKAVADILSQLDLLRTRREAAAQEQHRAWERQKEEQQEKARIDALHGASDALRRYQDMMQYIEEVRRFGRVPDNQRKEGQSLEEWLQWAEWQARRIHPLG